MNAELKFSGQRFLFDFLTKSRIARSPVLVWDVSLVSPTPFGVCSFLYEAYPRKLFVFEKRTQNKECLL